MADPKNIVRVELDPSLQKQAETFLEIYGLSLTDAFHLFVQQIVDGQGLPPSVNAEDAVIALARETLAIVRTRAAGRPEISDEDILAEIQAARKEGSSC